MNAVENLLNEGISDCEHGIEYIQDMVDIVVRITKQNAKTPGTIVKFLHSQDVLAFGNTILEFELLLGIAKMKRILMAGAIVRKPDIAFR